jgi:hypothetical protein
LCYVTHGEREARVEFSARGIFEMTIDALGARVASVWEGLRSTTRKLIVGALQARQSGIKGNQKPAVNVPYDARSDWELSRLLAALDERAKENLTHEQALELRQMAETCASVLYEKTRSAEVFAQLVERAMKTNDYKRIDSLGNILVERFAPNEVCELLRQANPVARALAHEALTQFPTSALFGLLNDPLDAEIARDAIERQAFEFNNEEAREVLAMMEHEEFIGDIPTD